MQWWIDFTKLSASQRNVIDTIKREPNQDYWISGFAGTGKTLVLRHLMEQISVMNPTASLCYITFTNTLVKLVKSTPGFSKIIDRSTIDTYHNFLNSSKKYDFVFLDEVQDTQKGQLARIKSLSKRLYIAGDPDQQIYPERLDVKEIMDVLHPVKKELVEVHRLTDRVCNVALSILPGAHLASGMRTKVNPNASVTLAYASNQKEEIDWVWQEALDRSRALDPSTILFATHKEVYRFACQVASSQNKNRPPWPEKIKGKHNYTQFNEHFVKIKIPLVYLGSKFGSLEESDHKPIVYLMTYHSAKGLDFKNVFVPFMDSNKFITGDSDLSRRLLFVAVTRSREKLFISYSAQQLHQYLSGLTTIKGVETTDIAQLTQETNGEEDFF